MSLDELAREGARRMLAAALEAEVDVYLAAFAELVDERGHRLVRRNGHAPARQLATGAGQVEVVRPRVDDRRVDPTAASASRSTASSCPMVPPLAQGGPGAGAAVPARAQLQRLRPRVGGAVRLGGGPVGLGVTRLPSQWQAEREASPSATCLRSTLCPAGLMACTAASAWATRGGGAGWSSWGCGPTAPRSRWRGRWHPRVDRRPGRAARGPQAPRHGAPVVMVGDGALGCGGRWGRSSPPPASSAAGCTRPGTFLARCPRAATPAPAGP
jgi:hypothetical protein